MENKESYFFSDTAKLNRALVVYCGDWENCNPLQISNPEQQYHYLFCYITKGKGKFFYKNDYPYSFWSMPNPISPWLQISFDSHLIIYTKPVNIFSYSIRNSTLKQK